MIGATTLDEYREYIEKDAALERRFQQVFVGEPSVEDTIGILRGLKEKYEAHHRSPSPTRHWWRRRRSPIATSRHASCPTRRSTSWTRGIQPAAHGHRLLAGGDRHLQRQVDRMKMQELALTGETDEASKERLKKLQSEMADRRRNSTACAPAGSRRRAHSTRSVRSRSSSTICVRSPSARNARATSNTPPRSSTVRFRRWRHSSPKPPPPPTRARAW